MPWTEGTLTPGDVAKHLGVPVDDRLTRATDVARGWGQRRRSLTDPLDLWSDPVAHDGGVGYAALLYQSKAASAGFASYDAAGEDFTAFARAAEHIGVDPVIA